MTWHVSQDERTVSTAGVTPDTRTKTVGVQKLDPIGPHEVFWEPSSHSEVAVLHGSRKRGGCIVMDGLFRRGSGRAILQVSSPYPCHPI